MKLLLFKALDFDTSHCTITLKYIATDVVHEKQHVRIRLHAPERDPATGSEVRAYHCQLCAVHASKQEINHAADSTVVPANQPLEN